MPSIPRARLPSFYGLLLVLNALTVSAATIQPRATTIPAPIDWAPNQYWDGIDGSWSSFDIRVGTPAQIARVFPSWITYSTWVISPRGCPDIDTTSAGLASCSNSRGGLFDTTASSTWDAVGLYSLWLEQNLGYGGNANFGYDTVGLGLDGTTLKNTTVGQLAVYDFYIGAFGLNPKPTNWSSLLNGAPSYMTTLKEDKLIPSVSFGFTAGAPYRYSGIFASLTLGGYDTSRFVENDVEFVFAQDNERDLVVGIQSITTPSQNATGTNTELLPTPIYALVDNLVPQIWLPIEACRAFEQEFGLIYDDSTDLYVINASLHDSLLERNANVTFTVGQGATGGKTVDVVLPYAAFDQTVKSPYQNKGYDRIVNSTTYFPLRRAQNSTQYTLGRTFMQEAYITVDYERVRFNISQVNWQQSYTPNLVAIRAAEDGEASSYSGNTATPPQPPSSLSGGAIAGIVIGAIVIIAAIVALLVWHFRRSKRHAFQLARQEEEQAAAGSKPDTTTDSEHSTAPGDKGTQVLPKAELDGSSPYGETKGLLYPPQTPTSPSSPGYSTYNSSTGTYVFTPTSPIQASEADAGVGAQIFEMPGDMPVLREADGKQITEKDMMRKREEQYNGVDPSPTVSDAPQPFGDRTMVNPDAVQEVRGGRDRQFSFSKDDDAATAAGHGTQATLAGRSPVTDGERTL